MEYEVERLALGLQHVPFVTVARLDASQPGAAAFLAAALPGVERERLPAVLLYPEASTGYVRLRGRAAKAEDILRGINKLYGRILPHRPELALRGVEDEAGLAERMYGGPAGLARQRKREKLLRHMELMAAARERVAAEAAAEAAEAAAEAAAGGGAASVGNPPASTVTVTAPAPVVLPAGSYWTGDKAVLWGVVAGLSALGFAWDMWLAAAWDTWQLGRRQRRRSRGYQYDKEQDLEDVGIMLYDAMTAPGAGPPPPGVVPPPPAALLAMPPAASGAAPPGPDAAAGAGPSGRDNRGGQTGGGAAGEGGRGGPLSWFRMLPEEEAGGPTGGAQPPRVGDGHQPPEPEQGPQTQPGQQHQRAGLQ